MPAVYPITFKARPLKQVTQNQEVYVAPFPFKVTWDITHKCNLRCSHCFVIFQENIDSSPNERSHHLKIARSIAAAEPFVVSIAGGEPFVVPHLIEIVEILRQSVPQIVIATNGTILKKSQLEQLAKLGGVSLQVSLDGSSAIEHDSIRGFGSYAKTLAFLYAIPTSLPTVIATTLTETVSNSLSELLELAVNLNVQAIKLQQFVITASVPNRFLAPSPASVKVASEFVAKYLMNKNSGPMLLHPFGELHEGIGNFINTDNASAGVGLRECTITPKGNLVLCGAVLDDCDAHGNLTQQPLSELWLEMTRRRASVSGLLGHCLCNS